ncbi:MAG: FAD/NAD(P)-binding protein [Cognatishimia sp.]|uniref:FAD/NAD(P)-binding protein n=1 Tax=Cognatishimia sp. TaxID=2211648 RepID=UPI003B8B3E07
MNDTVRSETHAKTHLIVGDGTTAVAFLEKCTLGTGDKLIILGKNASELGRGAAYAKGNDGDTWRYAYLLNSPADDIDREFAQWLTDNWQRIRSTMEGRTPNWLAAAQPLVDAGNIFGLNAPREFYGDFMCEHTETVLAGLRGKGVQIDILNDEATALDTTDAGIRVRTVANGDLIVDSVDIAPGGPSTLRIPGDEGAFGVPNVFGYEAQIAEHILAGREIFCIGGNAAMLDVLRLCQSLIPDAEIKMAFCAPDGEVPAPLIPRLPRKLTEPTFSKGHETAESFLNEVRREIDLALERGDEMREIRAGFRGHFLENPLSSYITDADEARSVPATLRFWLRGGTRDTILDLHDFIKGGQARIVTGLVKQVEHGTDSATVRVIDALGNVTSEETGFVINTAGAGPNSKYDPLTEDMLDKGLIEACPISKGIKVGDGLRSSLPAVRHLSPATTVIGEETMAMPLYDVHMLRHFVAKA